MILCILTLDKYKTTTLNHAMKFGLNFRHIEISRKLYSQRETEQWKKGILPFAQGLNVVGNAISIVISVDKHSLVSV